VRTNFKIDKTTSEKIGPFYFVNVSESGELGLLIHYKSGELASKGSEKIISELVDSVSLSN
jgi:hypothetical protein